MRTRAALCCVVFATLCGSTGAKVSESNDQIKNQIVEAWKHREQSAKTVNAQIDEMFTRTAGTLTGVDAGVTDKRLPEKDTTKAMLRTLVLDGDQMLHGVSGETWYAPAKDFVMTNMAAATNGTVAHTLYARKQQEEIIHSRGYIDKTAKHPDCYNMHLVPVLWHYRPFTEAIGAYDPSMWTIVDESVLIEDSLCVLIQEGNPAGRYCKEFIVDTEKGMSVVRYRGISLEGQCMSSKSATVKMRTMAGCQAHGSLHCLRETELGAVL